MGISNVSTSLRAGVCTSTTRPNAPYEGQTIYETDTDLMYVWSGATWIRIYSSPTTTKGDIQTYSTVPDRLAVGSNNTYLRANSSASTGLEWSSNAVGLELIASTTFTNSNNLLMNGVFSSTYDNYVVNVNLTSVSSATTIFMRLANGTTVDASGIYLFGGFISYMGSGILSAVNGGGATTDWALAVQEGTYGYGNTPMRIEIMQPMLSYRTAFFSSGFQPVNPLPYYRHIGGVTSNTSTYNGFTLIGNNSSFTISATISVYGYRK